MGIVAVHDGVMWVSVKPGIVCEPSTECNGWEPHSGEIIPFWQAGPHANGDRVRDAGKVWVALSDVDGQRPSEYPGGWAVAA